MSGKRKMQNEEDRSQESEVRIWFDGLENFGFARGESLILYGLKGNRGGKGIAYD